jgi:hypothetical protein
MLEATGNLWDWWEAGEWIVITTNGTIKKNGECVMGRGIAAQAKKRFPKLPAELGQKLSKCSPLVYAFRQHRLLSFPVKYNWYEKADLELIHDSACHLQAWVSDFGYPVYMPRPGCGNGKLNWEDVKPRIAPVLDNRITIVELPNANTEPLVAL